MFLSRHPVCRQRDCLARLMTSRMIDGFRYRTGVRNAHHRYDLSVGRLMDTPPLRRGAEHFEAVSAVVKALSFDPRDEDLVEARDEVRRLRGFVSAREWDVLWLRAHGWQSREIGARLGITANTVDVHAMNGRRRLALIRRNEE